MRAQPYNLRPMASASQVDQIAGLPVGAAGIAAS